MASFFFFFVFSTPTLSSSSSSTLLPPQTQLGEIARKARTSGGPNSERRRRTLTTTVKCSAAAPYEGDVPKFPRMNVWDSHRRLGISPYSSEEEIWSSRNFLLEQYAGDERSEESIEASFEKLLMTSFKERKRSKINLKSSLKKKVQESPPWFLNFLNLVEMPPNDIILKRLAFFALMGVWSIIHSAEGGPAFQVFVSLAACVYFLHQKTKSWGRAAIVGMGTLVTGVVVGSVLGPLVPIFMLPRTWTLELLTSFVAYFFLFLGCTFLK